MLKLHLQTIDGALDSSYKKENLDATTFASFKTALADYIQSINAAPADEVNCKTHLTNFLRDTFFKKEFELNTKPYIGNFGADLVIKLNSPTKDTGVLFELKQVDSHDMISEQNLNQKALHEVILYYLWEKNKLQNHEIKHIIVSNYKELFVFNAEDFNHLFQNDKAYKTFFDKWSGGHLDADSTKFFYQEVAKIVAKSDKEIPATYINLWKYKKLLDSDDKNAQTQLSRLYKFLSPRYILKQANPNDSNSLNKDFYYELLHIIGLKEKPEGGKTLIGRKPQPDAGSLLENTISRLKSKDAISKLTHPEHFGATEDEQYFHAGLELCITWLNRILFLKLLEGQLVSYHGKANKKYAFLNATQVKNFDELNILFFDVLAKDDNREPDIKTQYAHVPYLNSSLFDRTSLEEIAIEISALRDMKIPVFSSTILKDETGKIPLNKKDKNVQLGLLDYLLRFLEAYDFGAEENETIDEETKPIISASVLGLIFEKINGYKDGSFFTPGFITMYMCRETLRRAVVQKFKEAITELDCDDFEQLCNYTSRKNKNADILAFNAIINSLKICDPAVGSGHFLVSALNELIAIKSDLGILADHTGKLLPITAQVKNDELEIHDSKTNDVFHYAIGTGNKPAEMVTLIQQTLFTEKQTIIEKCLFGVDINPNSVKICRLRLWIELLKSAFYTPQSNYTKLHTLPNIDINIKKGNSLISRFKTNFDVGSFKNMNLRNAFLKAFANYTVDVQAYKTCQDKKQKDSIRQRM